jgi:YidC/Oxa1 family membrane protein insertase
MSLQKASPSAVPSIPANFGGGAIKTILVVGLLALIAMNWTAFISFFVNVLLFIYDSVWHNFGIAIILFTVLIKVVTWPLNAAQMKGALAMQEMQNDKDWQAIQKKYAKDREKLAQEQMRVYKEKGISPFASCLPTLIQFPLIIALYQSITRALATTPDSLLQLARSAYPILNVQSIIPLNSQFLWMDLSRPESVAVFGFALPTLAIAVAASTYMQSKLMAPASSNPNDQGAAMSRQMTMMMPLMMGWFALTFPSGLAIYFLTSNALGIIQYAAQGKANWRSLLPGYQPDPLKK